MLYKYSFSILYGHLNLNQKRKKLNLASYHSNRPVTTQTDRLPLQTGRLTGPNRLNCPIWIWIWIWLVFTNNQSNRSGLSKPVAGGLDRLVGKKNLGCTLGVKKNSWRTELTPSDSTAAPCNSGLGKMLKNLALQAGINFCIPLLFAPLQSQKHPQDGFCHTPLATCPRVFYGPYMCSPINPTDPAACT